MSFDMILTAMVTPTQVLHNIYDTKVSRKEKLLLAPRSNTGSAPSQSTCFMMFRLHVGLLLSHDHNLRWRDESGASPNRTKRKPQRRHGPGFERRIH